MSKYIKRAQDSLDIHVVTEVLIQKLSKVCKASVVHSISQKMISLKNAKFALERKLEGMVADKARGLLNRFKRALNIKALKQQISDLNSQIVQWINSSYRYFVAK